jgi:cell shape-determining protein MreC
MNDKNKEIAKMAQEVCEVVVSEHGLSGALSFKNGFFEAFAEICKKEFDRMQTDQRNAEEEIESIKERKKDLNKLVNEVLGFDEVTAK